MTRVTNQATYTRIVVPLDGSTIAEGVLPYAHTLAMSVSVPVHLFQVIDPDTLKSSVPSQQVHHVSTDNKEDDISYLKRIAASFSSPTAVSCSIRVGKPAEAIIELAARESGTLIAMATHGLSGIQRWLLGSVAEKVLQGASNDVLLIRAVDHRINSNISRGFKRLVIPLDGSELAEEALLRGVELAKKMNLEVILLRIYLMPGVAYPTGSYAPDWKLLDQEMRQKAGEYLEGKAGQLRNKGLQQVSFRVLEGNTAEKIIEVTQENSESLLVMCTHGASGIGRWLLGSVTERVVRHSNTGVLVVRAKHP